MGIKLSTRKKITYEFMKEVEITKGIEREVFVLSGIEQT